MSQNTKPRIHVNLPASFFEPSCLDPVWTRLDVMAQVTRSSCDKIDALAPHLSEADAILMWAWPAMDAALLDTLPRLKMGAFMNINPVTGRAFFAKGLAISEARHGWSPSVAELTLGLIMNGLRQISAHHMAFRAGREQWIGVHGLPNGVDARERQLTGRSVGIIGFGAVGQRLGELLQPFRTTTRIYDPYLPPAIAEKAGVELVDLDTLIADSEIVAICAANTPETEHLIGAQRVARFQKDAVVVNTARASLIDSAALMDRLHRGDLIYLTDVFDREPVAQDDPIRTAPNAYGTPHRAGGLHESLARILTMLVDDIENHFSGRPLRYGVSAGFIQSLG